MPSSAYCRCPQYGGLVIAQSMHSSGNDFRIERLFPAMKMGSVESEARYAERLLQVGAKTVPSMIAAHEGKLKPVAYTCEELATR